jgi:hypothetical protein
MTHHSFTPHSVGDVCPDCGGHLSPCFDFDFDPHFDIVDDPDEGLSVHVRFFAPLFPGQPRRMNRAARRQLLRKTHRNP